VKALSAAGLVALSLPVCLSLFTTRLPQGHDALEYLPRLVEFHENVSHGILLPRWAPDLSRGNGQPLFLFNPPLIYYLGEGWHLLGFDFVTAMNLSCIVIVLASACSMFLLGRLYFGDAGGWLAAAAYLYAPYFSVNLYVRSALAEFTAFPFFALALFGFGSGRLVVGAMGYAGVLCSHPPAAVLFTPLLVAFLCFTAWRAKSCRASRSNLRIPSRSRLGRVSLAARPGRAPVHQFRSPARRLSLLQPLCLSAPVVLLVLGIRILDRRLCGWDVLRAGREPSPARVPGLADGA